MTVAKSHLRHTIVEYQQTSDPIRAPMTKTLFNKKYQNEVAGTRLKATMATTQ